jgi:hypothetical protein
MHQEGKEAGSVACVVKAAVRTAFPHQTCQLDCVFEVATDSTKNLHEWNL